MRKYLLTGLLALAPATAAQAAPTIIFTPGVFTVPAFTTATVQEDFSGGVAGTQYNPATQASAFTQTRSAGSDIKILNANFPADGFQPDGGTDNYLSVENGSLTIGFGAGVQVLSFVFGTLDSYNSLTLNFADGTSIPYLGDDICNNLCAAPFGGGKSTGRVTYDQGGGAAITSAVFSSSQAAFEIDAIATAVPEPATWGMMILGFGLIGSQLRSRKRQTKISFA